MYKIKNSSCAASKYCVCIRSVASMMDVVAAKAEDMVLAVNDNDVVEKKGKAFDHGFEKVAAEKRSSSCCQKTDGKGWQCRNEAKERQVERKRENGAQGSTGKYISSNLFSGIWKFFYFWVWFGLNKSWRDL